MDAATQFPPRYLFGMLFIALIGLVAGCSESQPAFEAMEKPGIQERTAGRLVGTVVPPTDLESGERGHESSESDWKIRREISIPQSPIVRSADHRPRLLAVRLQDNTAYGVPIGLFSDQTLLMKSDGSIQRINNLDILQQVILKDCFQPMDQKELTQQLRAEFGNNYLVRNESPYLIVARSEHMEGWSQRFRSLYHSFKLYCTTNGLPVREIEFPLVAVVFGSRSEFLRYANASGVKLPDFCVGYYFTDSNRILLYESPDTSKLETQNTISHEATHQLAFNMGLHQRRASTPLWLIEGLATMFESPRLSGLQARDGKSLWPTSRKSTWQKIAKRPESVQRIVAGLIHNDQAFETDFENAYTVGWAMSTYLSQRRSQQFGPYLQRVGNMPPFHEYDASQRVADFQSAFGTDARLLTTKIIKYLETLD